MHYVKARAPPVASSIDYVEPAEYGEGGQKLEPAQASGGLNNSMVHATARAKLSVDRDYSLINHDPLIGMPGGATAASI